MKNRDFNDYAQLVSPLVFKESSSGVPADFLKVAKLMVHDDPTAYEDLAQGMKQLALGQEITSLSNVPGSFQKQFQWFRGHVYLAAFATHFETLPPAIWSICEEQLMGIVNQLREVDDFVQEPPPQDQTEVVLWQALCLGEAAVLQQRDADIEVADCVIHQIVSSPADEGALIKQAKDESIDAWTYRELVGLHALANAALLRKNAAWSVRVEEIALYHLYHTQPDHYTSEPWGLFGFLWSQKTRSFGEQQIHDCQAYGLADWSSVLLADSVRCLQAFG